MFDLLPVERLLFFGILLLSVISSILAHLQIVKSDVKFSRLLVVFTSVQILLAGGLLAMRAVAVKAFPMSGVFESMLILMIFIGISFLLLSAYLKQIWFVSVTAWMLLGVNILAAVVAKPASVLEETVRTPWVVVHALSMTMAGAMIVLASTMAVLFLWSQKRLKSKRFVTLFGKMPTIETLEKLNLLGLRLSFAAMTLGLISGIGLIAAKSAGLGMTLADWLSDSKIVLVAVSWMILLVTLVLRRVLGFGGRKIAQSTLVVCFLILFAFIGSKIFCKSDHDFEIKSSTQSRQVE